VVFEETGDGIYLPLFEPADPGEPRV
jgi:hypothetical protein